MKNVPSIIRHRYKIESVLAIFAIAMFFGFIVPQIIMWGWGADPLRTMMFTLFGIVGLMGFSIAIKRHEEDRKRNEQTLIEHMEREKTGQIQRMHACIQQLSNESPFAVFSGALHEIEATYTDLDEENKELVIKCICIFIQSDRIWSPFSKGNPADARASEEYISQMNKICLAFKTLSQLTDNAPIEALKEKLIGQEINLSDMTFEESEFKFSDEQLAGCNLSNITLVATR